MSNEPSETPDIELFFKKVDANQRKRAEELLKNISATEACTLFQSVAEYVFQLESEKEDYKMQLAIDRDKIAELQRVVQVKDVILSKIMGNPYSTEDIIGLADEGLTTTPDDLSKFVTEEEYQKAVEASDMVQSQMGEIQKEFYSVNEEYLRVKTQLDLVIASYQEKLYEVQATKNFGLLKSHAEAMAELQDKLDKAKHLGEEFRILEQIDEAVQAYKKDFPSNI